MLKLKLEPINAKLKRYVCNIFAKKNSFTSSLFYIQSLKAATQTLYWGIIKDVRGTHNITK